MVSTSQKAVMQYSLKNTLPLDRKKKVSVAEESGNGKKVSTSKNKVIFQKLVFP